MKKIFRNAGIIVIVMAALFSRTASAQETAENLLMSTELLLISQVNLAILSLDLISSDMGQENTTVEEDVESLQTVVESLDLAKEILAELLNSNEIVPEDLEMLRLLDRANTSLLKSSKELIAYTGDLKDIHLSNFADEMQSVAISMEKVSNMLQ